MKAIILLAIGIGFILITPLFWRSGISADYTKKLQQQVLINTNPYNTDNSSSSPTDNSLGIIHYDGGKYTGQSAYFEAIIWCDNCEGGNQQVQVGLYTAGGSLVSNTTLSTTNDTPTRIRSSEITSELVDDTEYTVRIWLDATTGTAHLQTARLVIDQESSNIQRTITQVELGNHDTVSDVTYNLITGPKIFRWNEDDYTDISSIRFEASLNIDDGDGTAYAALSSSTDCSTTVSGSQVSTSNTSYTRVRSGDFSGNLDNNTNYWVCIRSTINDTASIINAKLIIEQENTQSGLSSITLYHPFNTKVISHDESTLVFADYPQQFQPAKFEADFINYYFEATMRTTGANGYIRLYDLDSASNISDSQLTVTSSGYSRLRTSNLTSMPTSSAEVDAQIWNDGTDDTIVSSSWLIIQINRILDPQLSFEIEGVNTSTEINGITTSANSTFDTLPFGNLGINIPKYVAHKLTVSSNAPGGYSVTLKVLNYLQGNYPGNNIDPFHATWSTPASWTNPTGTSPNDNSGWFGAHTTDERVTGWDEAGGKFGGISNTPVTVMYSDGPDEETQAHVVYVLGVNHFQPADLYSGTVVYNLVPTY